MCDDCIDMAWDAANTAEEEVERLKDQLVLISRQREMWRGDFQKAEAALTEIKDFVYDPLNAHKIEYSEIRYIFNEWMHGE